jgi:hypothetical protein
MAAAAAIDCENRNWEPAAVVSVHPTASSGDPSGGEPGGTLNTAWHEYANR